MLILNFQQQVMRTALYQASDLEQDLHTTHLLRIRKDECYYEKCLTDKICTGSSYNEKASEKFIVEFSKNKYIPLLFHDSKILQGRLGYSIIIN